jgi:hypothetical protein
MNGDKPLLRELAILIPFSAIFEIDPDMHVVRGAMKVLRISS